MWNIYLVTIAKNRRSQIFELSHPLDIFHPINKLFLIASYKGLDRVAADL